MQELAKASFSEPSDKWANPALKLVIEAEQTQESSRWEYARRPLDKLNTAFQRGKLTLGEYLHEVASVYIEAMTREAEAMP